MCVTLPSFHEGLYIYIFVRVGGGSAGGRAPPGRDGEFLLCVACEVMEATDSPPPRRAPLRPAVACATLLHAARHFPVRARTPSRRPLAGPPARAPVLHHGRGAAQLSTLTTRCLRCRCRPQPSSRTLPPGDPRISYATFWLSITSSPCARRPASTRPGPRWDP
jgi:hypothetical protein